MLIQAFDLLLFKKNKFDKSNLNQFNLMKGNIYVQL